ncbi:LA_3751/LA_3752 family putative glycosyltransferase [Leptospira sp. 'Mane']|uniref:LA_3751/LA_3752 family putative glycosyltransferase n=1 Tax=Leptospira sp. 'Mane' TaxID=3387407 RepID=UPI00398B4612
MKQKIINAIPLLILIIFSAFYIQKRIKLDGQGVPLIQSDAQIKYYQLIQYLEGGLQNHRCLYPGKSLDPDYRFFPFDYTWAVKGEGKTFRDECVFQYPYFFALVSIPIYSLFGAFGLTWICLFLYLITSFAVLFYIEKIVGLKSVLFRSLFAIISISGYPIYSAFEYTETTLAVLIVLIFLFYILDQSSASPKFSKKPLVGFLFGFVASLAPYLRSEMFIYLFLAGVLYLSLHLPRIFSLIGRNRFTLIGFLTGVILFAVWNQTEFGNIFGVRGRISLGDLSDSGMNRQLLLIKSFFLGDSGKLGFLKAGGILAIFGIVSLYVHFKNRTTDSFEIVFWSLFGIFSVIIVAVLSPYNPGGLFAGLRFTDLSFYSFLITSAYLIVYLDQSDNHRFRKWILIFSSILFASQIYLQSRLLKSFFPLMHRVQESQVQLLNIWKEGEKENLPVIHKNLFDALLISVSYLNQYHFLAINEREAKNLQDILYKNNISGFHLFWFDGEKPYDHNSSKKLYDEKINNRYEFIASHYQLVSDRTELGYRIQRYQKIGDK